MSKTHVFLDTETTGFGKFANRPREDAIVEVGFAYRIDGAVRKWDSMCNPGRQYLDNNRAAEALAVSHIDLTEIMFAQPAVKVSTQLNEALMAAGEPEDLVLHAYNIPFDRYFLGLNPWTVGKEYQWGEDVMDMAHNFFQLPAEYKIGLKRSLERLGLNPDGEPHRAVTDAVSAMMVYEAIVGRSMD